MEGLDVAQPYVVYLRILHPNVMPVINRRKTIVKFSKDRTVVRTAQRTVHLFPITIRGPATLIKVTRHVFQQINLQSAQLEVNIQLLLESNVPISLIRQLLATLLALGNHTRVELLR
jgi:hypothetical protein